MGTWGWQHLQTTICTGHQLRAMASSTVICACSPPHTEQSSLAAPVSSCSGTSRSPCKLKGAAIARHIEAASKRGLADGQ